MQQCHGQSLEQDFSCTWQSAVGDMMLCISKSVKPQEVQKLLQKSPSTVTMLTAKLLAQSCCTPALQRCPAQTGAAEEDLPCTHPAHHEPQSSMLLHCQPRQSNHFEDHQRKLNSRSTSSCLQVVQERVSWRGSELAKLMELPLAKLRMGAIFWVNHGTFPFFHFSQCSASLCLLHA